MADVFGTGISTLHGVVSSRTMQPGVPAELTSGWDSTNGYSAKQLTLDGVTLVNPDVQPTFTNVAAIDGSQTLQVGLRGWLEIDPGAAGWLFIAGAGACACPVWYTGYQHLETSTVPPNIVTGAILTPGQTIGFLKSLPPANRGPHLHFSLGDGFEFLNLTTGTFIGQSLEIESWFGYPISGTRAPAAPGPVYYPPRFSDCPEGVAANNAFIKSVFRSPIVGSTYKIVHGSTEHKAGEYYAVDIFASSSTPGQDPVDPTMVGAAVINAIATSAADTVESRVYAVVGVSATLGTAVIVEHRRVGCKAPPVSAWKKPVRAATTVAGTLSASFAAGQVVDGVTLALADRILIKNQANAADNGIYLVSSIGKPWRAPDAAAAEQLLGATVAVTEGAINADTVWLGAANAPIVVGTTALPWGQVGGNNFGIVAVAGQSNVVADQPMDTLTLEAGLGIILTTDAATDKVRISSNVFGGSGSGSGSGGSCFQCPSLVAPGDTFITNVCVIAPASGSGSGSGSGDGNTTTNSATAFPVGGIAIWPKPSAYPSGWLHCDGTAVSRTSYADLFAVIGTRFGVGNGSTTFNLPTKAQIQGGI